jgi:hypothetical protein
MKLRLGRRANGPAAAHHSRYGPQNAPKITSTQRDAVYRQILDHMGNAGDLSLLVEHGDLRAARRLAREVSDDLRLVLDALGWGETSSDGYVELELPGEQLRRTFARLRQRAVEDRDTSPQGPTDAQPPYERALIVIETCDQVLAVVGGDTQAAPG